MLANDPPFIGDWVRERKLGAGGFGVVTLWKNAKTEQRVAVKQCHPPATAGDQHAEAVRRRWHLEVDYMTEKVSHDNIVRGIHVEPASFVRELERLQQPAASSAAAAANIMPVLLMEYCEGGDLRGLLNTSEYACGFPESEARDVLRNLGAAVAYLHQIKITHRDIKPENIVMRRDADGRRVYKLTDLGYAKPLDHRTIVASVVGTLEYIAPELCLTDRYTNTVDYWSMGVIAYEIVTGVRPFVPHLPLARWMIVVKGKKSKDIAITEGNADGSFRLEQQLPREHRLSALLAEQLESWLQLALEWNPKQRGHVFRSHAVPASADAAGRENQLPPTLELRIFSQLTGLLDRRILRFFCLRSYRELCVELTADMRMAELSASIADAAQIPMEKLRLVLPVAHPYTGAFGVQTAPSVLWWPDHDGPMFYVYQVDPVLDAAGGTGAAMMSASTLTLARLAQAGAAAAYANKMDVPAAVAEVLAAPARTQWRPHVVRRFATAAFHVCRREQQLYRTALAGWHALALRVNHDMVLNAATRTEEMQRRLYRLEGALSAISDTMRLLAAEMADDGAEIADTTLLLTPEDGAHADYAKLSERMRKLMEACEKIVKRYKSLLGRSHEACQRPLLERRADGVDRFGVEEVAKSMQLLRSQQQPMDAATMRKLVDAVEACRLKRQELLLDKEWGRLQEYPAMAYESEEIKKAIEMAMEMVIQYQEHVLALNATLFKAVRTSAASTSDYLPAIEGIGGAPSGATATHATCNGNGVEFHIGQVVNAAPFVVTHSVVSTAPMSPNGGQSSSMLTLGDMKTTTLISSNEEMLAKMEDLFKKMNAEFVADSTSPTTGNGSGC